MDIGFIVLRHVHDDITRLYWKECCRCITQFYPESKIIIIDDKSEIDISDEKLPTNTTLLNSNIKASGEILPYYYYIRNKWFQKAVIIHDSIFINSYIDFSFQKYKILWDFPHIFDNVNEELKLINYLDNNEEVISRYKDKQSWNGCFGGMTCIDHDYLLELNNKYDLIKFSQFINDRRTRQCWERILGCLLNINCNISNNVLLSDINSYCKFGYTYNEYINNCPNNVQPYQMEGIKAKNIERKNKQLPIIKIWSLR